MIAAAVASREHRGPTCRRWRSPWERSWRGVLKSHPGPPHNSASVRCETPAGDNDRNDPMASRLCVPAIALLALLSSFSLAGERSTDPDGATIAFLPGDDDTSS